MLVVCTYSMYTSLFCQGWGMVRVDNPKLGAGRVIDQIAPWDSFQVLGPHSGVNICDTNSIKRCVTYTYVYVVVLYTVHIV